MSFQLIVKKFFLILVGFFYALSANSSDCDLLLKSTEVISLDPSKFLAEVYTSPVRDQCYSGSCSFQGSIGMHENISRANFDIDYNIISSMLDRADRLVTEKEDRVTIEMSPYLDLMPGQAISDAIIEIENHGVLAKGEFSLSDSTKELLRSEVAQLRKKGVFERNEGLNTVDSINIVLGYHLSKRWKSRSFKRLHRSLKEDIIQYRVAAKSKHQELFGRISSITNYYNNIASPLVTHIESKSSIKVKNIDSDFDQIVEIVISNLKKGNSVAMNYNFIKEVIKGNGCLLYTSPSPRDKRQSRMPSSA